MKLQNNFIYKIIIFGLSFILILPAWSYSIDDEVLDAKNELAAAIEGDTTIDIEKHLRTTASLAEKGFSFAQVDLGYMYDVGNGVRQDYAKAREWYMKAASYNNSDAQGNLGVMYYRGNGVRQDYAKAREWYMKAAKRENPNAQKNLGIMYSEGQGVRQNYAQAKEWYGKACDNGLQDGCDEYRRLNIK